MIRGSPAERSGQLNINDRLLEVNGINVVDLPHGDIVGLVKSSGYSVTLKIARPGIFALLLHCLNFAFT